MLFRKTFPSRDAMISDGDGSRSVHSPDIMHIQCSIFQYPYPILDQEKCPNGSEFVRLSPTYHRNWPVTMNHSKDAMH